MNHNEDYTESANVRPVETISRDTVDPGVEASLSAKEIERKKIQEEIEAFLKSGGAINEIAPNVTADPPKKPESNYGGQPI